MTLADNKIRKPDRLPAGDSRSCARSSLHDRITAPGSWSPTRSGWAKRSLLGESSLERSICFRKDDSGIERIDILYICSNANIARQNIAKLDVLQQHQADLDPDLVARHSTGRPHHPRSHRREDRQPHRLHAGDLVPEGPGRRSCCREGLSSITSPNRWSREPLSNGAAPGSPRTTTWVSEDRFIQELRRIDWANPEPDPGSASVINTCSGGSIGTS